MKPIDIIWIYIESKLGKNTFEELRVHLSYFCCLQGFSGPLCEICNAEYANFDELNAHCKSEHSAGTGDLPRQNGKYICEFCALGFTHKYDVYRHQRRVHGRESIRKKGRKPKYQGNVKCDLCGVMLSSKQKLKGHLKCKHAVELIV